MTCVQVDLRITAEERRHFMRVGGCCVLGHVRNAFHLWARGRLVKMEPCGRDFVLSIEFRAFKDAWRKAMMGGTPIFIRQGRNLLSPATFVRLCTPEEIDAETQQPPDRGEAVSNPFRNHPMLLAVWEASCKEIASEAAAMFPKPRRETMERDIYAAILDRRDAVLTARGMRVSCLEGAMERMVTKVAGSPGGVESMDAMFDELAMEEWDVSEGLVAKPRSNLQPEEEAPDAK